MRIAFFTDNFYPELSGISDSVVTIARELASRGDDILICAPSAPAKSFEIGGVAVGEIDLGPRVIVKRLWSMGVPMATGQARAVIPFFSGTTAFLREWKPDLIHVHTFFGAGWVGVFAAKRLEVPLVGTNHTALESFVEQLPLGRLWMSVALATASRFYNRAVLVSTPSHDLLRDMQANDFRGRGVVVSNPINTEVFAPGDGASGKARWRLSPHTFSFAGRFAPEKCIDLLIRALPLVRKEVPDAQLALAGHGTGRAALLALSESLGVSDGVVFVGTLSQSDLAELFRASELFAIASTSETQGMVLLQAMSTGLPAVGVRARSLPEYIDEGVTGSLVNPGDHVSMAREIVILLKDAQKARAEGVRARDAVLQYSVSSIATQWENLYEEVMVGVIH